MLLVSSDGCFIHVCRRPLWNSKPMPRAAKCQRHNYRHTPADITCKKRKPLYASVRTLNAGGLFYGAVEDSILAGSPPGARRRLRQQGGVGSFATRRLGQVGSYNSCLTLFSRAGLDRENIDAALQGWRSTNFRALVVRLHAACFGFRIGAYSRTRVRRRDELQDTV
jgi:hypothetical protein